MPISEDQAFLVARSTAHDRDGTRIGPVSGVYYDDHTGRPEWVTVTVGTQDEAPASSAGRSELSRVSPPAKWHLWHLRAGSDTSGLHHGTCTCSMSRASQQPQSRSTSRTTELTMRFVTNSKSTAPWPRCKRT